MKIVVTCGSPWSDLQAIEALLQTGGMLPSKAAKRDASETIQAWHDRAVTAYSDDADGQLCPVSISPSKPWEQMATDIFAANADQSCWGWADAKSTWFLDFWLNYDPHFRFVLIYAAPHKDFAKFIYADNAEYKANDFIQTWLGYNRELLKFYNRHPDRSVLLNYEACANASDAFKTLCSEKLGLNFTKTVPAQIKPDDALSLLELLALQVLEPYQEAKELFAEMEATTTGLKIISAKDAQNKRLSEAVAEYQNLRKRSQQWVNAQQETLQLAKDKANLSDRLAVIEREHDRLNQSQRQLQQQLGESRTQNQASEKNRLALQEQIKQLSQEKIKLTTDKTNLENRITALEDELEQSTQMQHLLQQQLRETQVQHQAVQKEIQQENELLLLQLHQVQEELEHYFVELQTQQASNQDTTTLLHSQIDQVSQLTAVKTDLKNRIAALKGELEQSTQAQHLLQQQLRETQVQHQAVQKEIQQENELLLLQLYQVQEELERYFVELQTQQASNQDTTALLHSQIDQVGQLTAIKTDLENRIAALEGEHEPLTQTILLLQKQLSEPQAQQHPVQQEIQQENELLLLQLHQVQEELEYYFIEYQALQSRNQETVSRLQKLYTRFPDYYDYSAIDVCDVDKRTDYYAIEWNIGDFLQGNRDIPKLRFKTVVANGSMGLLFNQENTDSLLSWLLHISNQPEFFLILFAKQTDESGTIFNQLSKLAATDWIMLKALFNTLTNALEQENILSLDARSKIDVAYWLKVITVMRQAYLNTPDAFRFDKVSLYKEHVNSDYEHLWFKFKGVRFGDSYWPDFQFRLSAANVKPESFSVFPKLEFPLSDDKTLPFQKWYIEINDAVGERMELRFALTPPAIDIQVWNSFTTHDQALVASILQQTPFILEIIEKQGSRISRPYDDWKKIAKDMQDVFKLLIPQA